MVQPRPPLWIDYRTLNAHCHKDTRKDYWTKAQPVNGVEVLTSALASMCLADYDLMGSQLSPGTPTSPPQDRMTANPLSLYASCMGFLAQHAENGCNKALREIQYDQPMEEGEALIPLRPSPVELAPPLAVGPDNETSAPETSPLLKLQTRSESRMAGYVIL